MVDKCQNCGTIITAGSNFCLSCGKPVNDEKNNQPSIQESIPQESYGQTQEYSSMPPKKTNKKIIGGLIAIIAFVVIIAIVIIVFLGGSSSGQFVGTWDMSSGEGSTSISATITFKANGDLMGNFGIAVKIGTWSVEGDKLCLDTTYITGSISNKQCVGYSFSDDGNTLTLQGQSGLGSNLILTRR